MEGKGRSRDEIVNRVARSKEFIYIFFLYIYIYILLFIAIDDMQFM